MLLLDEPLGALDALTRGTLQNELARIWEQERTTCVMITNDVDEAILLADRIVPLTPGPAATLGPSFAVELARPRDRKELNHDPQFQASCATPSPTWLVESRKQRLVPARSNSLAAQRRFEPSISRGKLAEARRPPISASASRRRRTWQCRSASRRLTT